MTWSVEDAKRYLSEFGLKPELSRIGTDSGEIYLSNIRRVAPSNMNDSNKYAYYIYSQGGDAKALLVTTSTGDSKYIREAEFMFRRLLGGLVKQTTSSTMSKNFSLEDGSAELVENTFVQIERNREKYQGSLRGIISLENDADKAKEWVSVINDARLENN
ncbi:hypothetical protein [Vibrio sp. WXL210]|uniref:hypothetical protein n=1 Tax=Vibrio sp. WXL210 TaxID=3450709 RepID=UPI003EC81251